MWHYYTHSHIFTQLPNNKMLDSRVKSGDTLCDIADHLVNLICMAPPIGIKHTNMPKVSICSNKNHEELFDKLSTTNCEELLYAHETTNEKYDTFLYTFKQAYLFSFPFKGLYGARSKDKKVDND